MANQLSQDDEFEGYPTGRVLFLGALGFAAAYLSRQGAGASFREWGYLLVGTTAFGLSAMDIKAGWALSFHRPVKRSKEPRVYWTSVVTQSALGLAAVVFSVGAMLGFWSV